MKSLHPVSEYPPPARTRAFWPSVRFFIETIWALFGGPEIIAAMHMLSRDEHKLLTSWLRKAEALVRKLLVIEAAYMQLTLTSAGAHGLAKPNRKAPAFDCETPHLWRVSFRIFSAPVYGGGDREAIPFERAGSQSEREAGEEKRHRDARFRQARPLAERFEALLRVFDAPENYICRVARLLRRRPHNTDILFAAPDVEGFEEIDEPVQAMLDDAPRARMRDTS